MNFDSRERALATRFSFTRVSLRGEAGAGVEGVAGGDETAE